MAKINNSDKNNTIANLHNQFDEAAEQKAKRFIKRHFNKTEPYDKTYTSMFVNLKILCLESIYAARDIVMKKKN